MGDVVPVMSSRTARSFTALALLVFAAGCAASLRERSLPALSEPHERMTRVAVAPFSAATSRGVTLEDAALVSHQIAEALQARGLEVVPPGDVARAAGTAESAPATGSPEALARIVATRFGAQALVTGRVDRYRGRVGGPAGSTSPASVGFDVVLHTAPEGAPLWNATFDETQHGISDNLLNAFRYPGGGTRWLTVEELVRWGADEVAKRLPAGQ